MELSVRMSLVERYRRFGVDAPYVLMCNVSVIVLSMVLHAILRYYPSPLLGMVTGIMRNIAVISTLVIIFFLYSTLVGKFTIWKKLSATLPQEGKFLDVGCGRGMVLSILGQASSGRELYGLDIWRTGDQYQNSLEKSLANFFPYTSIKAELVTADARDMPFPDNYFDVVVSNLALHNIKNLAGEMKAMQEIIRVVKPGGKIVIADIHFLKPPPYLIDAQTQLTQVELASSGLKGWCGPLFKTFILQGYKKTDIIESQRTMEEASP